MRPDLARLCLLCWRRRPHLHFSSAPASASSETVSKPRAASGGKRYWRVPVMDGEFVCEDKTGCTTTRSRRRQPTFARHATVAAPSKWLRRPSRPSAKMPDNVITPFPGGIVRSGSKVGSKVRRHVCLSQRRLRPHAQRRDEDPNCNAETVSVLEIVIDGLTSQSMLPTPCAPVSSRSSPGGAAKGVTRVSAGNYGGKLGQHHYHLRELV